MRHLPNILSGYRIAASPILVVFCLTGNRTLFTWFLIASLITDILDGVIARVFNLKTPLGALLDSIGDMATFVAALIGVLVFHKQVVAGYWGPIVSVVGVYALQKIVALVRYGRISSFHTILAKINAYGQGAFLVILFLFGFHPILFFGVVGLSLVCYTEEILMVMLIPKWRPDVPGLLWMGRKSSAS